MKLYHDLCNRWALAVFTTAEAPLMSVFARHTVSIGLSGQRIWEA